MTSIRYTRSLIFLAIVACTRSASSPAGLPPEPLVGNHPASSPVVIRPGKSWTLTADSSPRHYLSTAQTTVELADSATIRDQVTRRVVFNLAFSTSSSGTRAVASIHEVSLSAGNRIGPSLPPVSLPFTIEGQIADGSLALQTATGQSGPGVLDCNNPVMAAFPSLQRAIVITPATVNSGMTWRDSSSTSSCSGSVPVSLTIIREYQVLGSSSYSGMPSILLERREIASFKGEGSQNQHRILISGTGTASSQIHLHPVSGQLMSLDGEHQADLVVISSGRLQKFRQVTREVISEVSN